MRKPTYHPRQGFLVALVAVLGIEALVFVLSPATAEAQVAGICRFGGVCMPYSLLATKTVQAKGNSTAPGGGNYSFALDKTVGVLSWCDTTMNCNWESVSYAAATGANFSNGGSGISLTAAQGIDVRSTIQNLSVTATPVTVDDAQGFRIVGVTNAGLTTCSAGAAGTVQYDTTNAMNMICDGTSWSPITMGAFYHARTPITGVINPDAYLIGGLPKLNSAGPAFTRFEIEGVWATAGTGAGTKTFAIWDATSNASRGTCTVTCTATALTPWSCGGNLTGAVSSAAYGLKITSATTCATTQPADLDVTVHLY